MNSGNLVIQIPGILYPVPLLQFCSQLPQWTIGIQIVVIGTINGDKAA